MSIYMNENVEALMKQGCHCLATCWKIERADGVIFYFTDSSVSVDLGGHTYTPVGGFDASARQTKSTLSGENLEVVGIISSDAITADDLRAGLFREAKVTETLIDWRYPWAGAIATCIYWIAETRFTEERWEAQVQGLTRWLDPLIGGVYTRNCRHKLGDNLCQVNLAAYTESGAVASIVTAKFSFTTSSPLSAAAPAFDYGKLVWTSGDNNGVTSEIKKETGNSTLELQLPTPFDIKIGDSFDATQGCDKLVDTCKTRFSNFDNYGGFPLIPGNDKMMQAPSVT